MSSIFESVGCSNSYYKWQPDPNQMAEPVYTPDDGMTDREILFYLFGAMELKPGCEYAVHVLRKHLGLP